MRKLRYTILNAESVSDPRKRSQMLAAAALEEAEGVLLLAKTLHLAERAAQEIKDEEQRALALENVYRVMERAGYDLEQRAFIMKRAARAQAAALKSQE